MAANARIMAQQIMHGGMPGIAGQQLMAGTGGGMVMGLGANGMPTLMSPMAGLAAAGTASAAAPQISGFTAASAAAALSGAATRVANGADSSTTTIVTAASGNGAAAAAAAAAAAQPAVGADGKVKARDFSFMVTEDTQDSGPNLTMLEGNDDSDSDSVSDDGGEGEGGHEPDDMTGFEAGSAIDQLLYRQKAVSGMETRRPGESAEQFFKRKVAGLRMLNADAGTAEAKQYEQDVDVAIMNSETAWHWGAGDQDADFQNDEDEPLMLTGNGSSSASLQLTFKNETAEYGSAGADSGHAGLGSGDGAGTLAVYDDSFAKRREIVGSEGIRAAASLVPKAPKDALSNAKLRPVESGRGLALLEKMGWKKGQGLGRGNDGATLPVEAMLKTDMGGLRVDGEEELRGGSAREFNEHGEAMTSDAFSVNAASLLAAARGVPVPQPSTAAAMDSEFSSITSQTKSVQQINEENRRAAAAGGAELPAPHGAPLPLPLATPDPIAAPPPPLSHFAPPPTAPPKPIAIPPPAMPPGPLAHAPAAYAPLASYPPPAAYPGYPPPAYPGYPPPYGVPGYPPAYPGED